MGEHGGNRAEIGRTYQLDSSQLIDFSANINPLGLSKDIRQSIVEKFEDISHYPDITYYSLHKKVSSFHRLPQEYFLCGNGEAEIIYLLAQSLQSKKVGLLAPTFSEYEQAFSLVGSEFVYVYLEENQEFNLSWEEIQKVLVRETELDCLCLCQPNNPTGKLISPPVIGQIVAYCKEKSIHLIIDEAFMDFLPNQESVSSTSLVCDNSHLYVLRSMTKFYAIPGLRLGYIITSNQKILTDMRRMQIPWSINTLADGAGQVAFEDEAYRRETLALIRKERSFLTEELNKIKQIKIFESEVNYLLFKIESDIDLRDALLPHDLLIRSCENYRGLSSKFYRIAVKKREENHKLVTALKRVLIL